MSITLTHPTGIIKGEINLTSSKSESNRALIIQSLCDDDFEIKNLSTSDDTIVLQKLLNSNDIELSVGLAGTAMRFLTAFLAIGEREVVLTGEHRMKERPIKILVDVLKQLGAEIQYMENDGYPPLKISGRNLGGGRVVIDGGVSSQYISALLMIAPKLKQGIKIEFEGEIISKPYIDMTISIMKHFGASVNWEGDSIVVKPGNYVAQDFTIEADWSAASYWYSIVALSKDADLTLYGLKQNSLQGDTVVRDIYRNFGVTTTFIDNGIRLIKNMEEVVSEFNFDFFSCPDIAQTVAVTCAALNVQAKLTGLKTLRIKETDRVLAIQLELTKLGYSVDVDGDDIVINSLSKDLSSSIVKTYNDHRMAMAFAPLALFGRITIEDESVVSKSYPNFWKDLWNQDFIKS